MNAVGEDIEESTGAFLCVDKVSPVSLSVKPSSLPGGYVDLTGFSGPAKLYQDEACTIPVTVTNWPLASMPAALYAKGITPGTVNTTLTYTAPDGSVLSDKLRVRVIRVQITGYVYGESGRGIPNIHTLHPAYVVSHGYLKLKATVTPASAINSLHYSWDKADGTFDGPTEGAGSAYTTVKWNGDAAENVGTVTLHVKPNSSTTEICAVPVELRDVRPYVVRVQFTKDQRIYDGASPEFDSIANVSQPVCYVMGSDQNTKMGIRWDMAGSLTDETVNNLSQKTEIQVFPVARYGSASLVFDKRSINANTIRWSVKDYSLLNGDQKTPPSGIWNKVAEFEDFRIEWTPKVKNSAGTWLSAWAGSPYQTTAHRELAGPGRTYGLYTVFAPHKCTNANFKKAYLDDAVRWAQGAQPANQEPNVAKNTCLSLSPLLEPGVNFLVNAGTPSTFDLRWSLTYSPAGAVADCAGWSQLMIDVLTVVGIGPYVRDFVNEATEPNLGRGYAFVTYDPTSRYYHPSDEWVKCPACPQGGLRCRKSYGGRSFNFWQGVCKKTNGTTCYSVQGPHIGVYEQLDNAVSYPDTSHTDNLTHAFGYHAWLREDDSGRLVSSDESPGPETVVSLSQNAMAGQVTIKVVSTAGFVPGDRIVIQDSAASDFATVTGVNAAAKTITLAAPLSTTYRKSMNGRIRKGHIKEPDYENAW